MKLRGRRECADCGEHWSYFETGDVACPACGSVRSVATERTPTLHTAGAGELDLSPARAAVEARPLRAVATRAAEACRSYLAVHGFVAAGELQPLDDRPVAVAELRAVADEVRRASTVSDDAERYFLGLLRSAPAGERPDDVPEGLRGCRGLGATVAVDRYRTDLSRYLDTHPDEPARRLLGRLRDHLRRIEALDGDVPVETADELVEAARELGSYVRGDESALARADDRLSRVASDRR